MKCNLCNCSDSYIKSYEHNYTFKGKDIKFSSERRFCSKCNNLLYDKDLDNEAGRKAIECYNKQFGIEKDKVIELRKKYKLSQAEFASIVGCARKTLISYEQGTAIPNDNYIIILNTLIENPWTIAVLIDANKDHFSYNEYEKINKKIHIFLDNNSKQLNSVEEFIPNEYNGYTKLNPLKVFNMISYFANDGVLKTKLLKEMFYADFLYYKSTGASITGLEYAKIPLGPVPDGYQMLLDKYLNENLISCDVDFKNDYELHTIKSIKKYDNKVFEKDELDVLKKVKDFFIKYGSKKIASFSHEEKAYLETKLGNKISYDYAFDINRII